MLNNEANQDKVIEVVVKMNERALRRFNTLREECKIEAIEAALVMLWRDPFFFQAFWNENYDKNIDGAWKPINNTQMSDFEFGQQNKALFEKMGIKVPQKEFPF